MTDRELMQMALDALDYVGYVYTTEEENQEVEQAIEALRTALAQPEKTDMQIGITYEEANPHVHAVDTSSERVHKTEKNEHEWVGLTYADLYFWGGELGLGELGKGVLRAVDAHLREKNT